MKIVKIIIIITTILIGLFMCKSPANDKKMNYEKVTFNYYKANKIEGKIIYILDTTLNFKNQLIKISDKDKTMYILYHKNTESGKYIIENNFVVKKDTSKQSYVIRDKVTNKMNYIYETKFCYKSQNTIIQVYELRSNVTNSTSYIFWNNELGLIGICNRRFISLLDKSSFCNDNAKIKAITDFILELIKRNTPIGYSIEKSESFDEFSKLFYSDSLFQLNRIIFPLENDKKIEKEYTSALRGSDNIEIHKKNNYHPYNKNNWVFLNNAHFKDNDSIAIIEGITYKRRFHKTNKFVEENFIYADDEFVMVILNFKSINGKWYLIDYIDGFAN